MTGVWLIALLASPAAGPVEVGDVEVGDVRAAVTEVYADDIFGRIETRDIWLPLRNDPDASPERVVRGSDNLIGMTLLSIATVIGVALLVMIGSAIWRGRRQPAAGAASATSGPTVLFGLDVRPESLPNDIVAAVVAAWEAGDALGALSLLYRGVLALVITRTKARIPSSATEGECVRAVRRAAGDAFGADFETLTRAWLEVAYARRSPSPTVFAQIVGQWRGRLTEVGGRER